MTLPPPPPDAPRYNRPPSDAPGVAHHERVEPVRVTPPSEQRRYDLDALRGFAMLLGIGLHAAIPFVPYWDDGDPGGDFLWGFFEFIHGFRMPLFFILSGYFTTMLWRRRGLRSLIAHRARRIGLPLLIGIFTVLPAVVVGIIAGYVISGVDLEDGADEAIGAYEEDLDRAAGEGAIPDDDKPDKAEQEPFGFAHMWFLWFLLWMVVGFAAVARLIGWLARLLSRDRPVPSWLSSIALLALPALAAVPASSMVDRVFGADTSEGWIPNATVLAYYACFFAFGALAYDRRTRADAPLIDAVGRWWPAQLAVGSLVLYPLGQSLMQDHRAASALLQVSFAWIMSFALMGLFRRFMAEPSFRVRYLSDASYWMYLAHLPLVFVAQGIATRIPLPAVANFSLICVTVTTVLVLSYRHLVRYRFIGRLLNGRRTKAADQAQHAALRARHPSANGDAT